MLRLFVSEQFYTSVSVMLSWQFKVWKKLFFWKIPNFEGFIFNRDKRFKNKGRFWCKSFQKLPVVQSQRKKGQKKGPHMYFEQKSNSLFNQNVRPHAQKNNYGVWRENIHSVLSFFLRKKKKGSSKLTLGFHETMLFCSSKTKSFPNENSSERVSRLVVLFFEYFWNEEHKSTKKKLKHKNKSAPYIFPTVQKKKKKYIQAK